MAKLTWLGDSDPEAQVITTHGVTFVKGEAVEVKDKAVAEKLSSNPMFSADAKAETAKADEPDEDERTARAEEGTEKGAIKAKLKEHGVEMRGNPSLETLRAKLVEATA